MHMAISRILIILMVIFASLSSFAKIEDLFEGMTEIKEPFNLRDPFLAPRLKNNKEEKITGKISKGNYSNIPVLGETKLEELEIIGVIIGKERRAFVKIKNQDNTTFTVKEGDTLGENRAELRAILPGGLVLVEKATNIYGEEEYLETVIPISK